MDVFTKVKAIILDQLKDVDEKAVTKDASFIDDLGAESLDVIEIIMRLEEEFGIEIPDEDAENINTVGELVKYIEEKISQV